MTTILDKIIETKHKEVAENRKKTPITQLETLPCFKQSTISLKQALLSPKSTGIIAEYKTKSPSKGIINDAVSVQEVTTGYVQAGATALSILTDQQYFGGSNKNLTTARKYNTIPILRKDFIVDEYQIIEAKAIGADAVLLIASALSRQQVQVLSDLAKRLQMDILFEIHTEEELEKLNPQIDVVGVNNRNLQTFETDIQTSIKLCDKIPSQYAKISESGIDNIETIKELKQQGYNGFLIGESFMKTSHPARACQQFINQIYQQ